MSIPENQSFEAIRPVNCCVFAVFSWKTVDPRLSNGFLALPGLEWAVFKLVCKENNGI
jgi:hypothetical protein